YTLKLPEGPRLLTQAGSYLQRHARYTEAESLLNRASAIYEQIFGPHHSLTVQSLEDLAGLYLAWKKYTEAEQFIKRALTIKEQVVGPTSLQTATCLNNLAFVCYKQGKYTEAEQHYQNSLSIKQQ